MHARPNERNRFLTRLLPVAVAAVLVAGCVDHTLLIKVRPDGSGEMIETTNFVGDMVGMMKAMMAQEKTPEQRADEERAKAEARAAQLGEGVRLVSWEDISQADTVGTRIAYRFDDITKLHVEPMASGDEDQGVSMSSESQPLTFRYDRNRKGGVLTVVLSEAKGEETEVAAAMQGEAAAGEEAATPTDDMADMMRPMLKGFRMRVLVEVVDGTIRSTDAPSSEGSVATIMDIDLDQVVSDDEAWAKLTAMGDDNSITSFGREMEGQPGITMPTGSEVRIEISD